MPLYVNFATFPAYRKEIVVCCWLTDLPLVSTRRRLLASWNERSMFSYYLDLALRSLKRNSALTGLMIVAIAFGISACMTTLTVFRAMSADPIPAKSHQLFAPQIQNSAPTEKSSGGDGLASQLTYQDAMALMQAHAAKRQSALYLTDLALRPTDPTQKSSYEYTRAAFSEFFGMFDVPFQYG